MEPFNILHRWSLGLSFIDELVLRDFALRCGAELVRCCVELVRSLCGACAELVRCGAGLR